VNSDRIPAKSWPADKSDIESELIKYGLCPKCGSDVRDKGTYIRCTKCPFEITNGVWAQEEGYCYQIVEEEWIEEEG